MADSNGTYVVKGFIISSMVYMIISMLLGILLSAMLLGFDPGVSFLSYGRLRPIHTHGTLFGFLTLAYFGLFFYIVPKLCRTELFAPKMAKAALFLWNAIILLAVVTFAAGSTSGREYLELNMFIDVLVVIAWVLVAIPIFGTIFKRVEKQMYVTLWYVMGTMVWVALLYIVANLPIYYGVNDANMNWWFGHSAVGFLFTTSTIAIGYYMIPKTTKQPLFSHALSLLGFWTLGFLYIWTGAHHLLYSPLPGWLQTIASAFSMLLWIPAFAVVVNFYGTWKGRWDLIAENMPLRFLIVGTTFYVIAFIQGGTQALRAWSQVVHFTDWVVGHAHLSMYGFSGFVVFGALYWLMPRICNTEIYSEKLVKLHFWLGLIGITAMMFALQIYGPAQGIMWREAGRSFMDTAEARIPFYVIRSVAGITMLVAQLLFVYNIARTMLGTKVVEGEEGVGAEAAPA